MRGNGSSAQEMDSDCCGRKVLATRVRAARIIVALRILHPRERHQMHVSCTSRVEQVLHSSRCRWIEIPSQPSPPSLPSGQGGRAPPHLATRHSYQTELFLSHQEAFSEQKAIKLTTGAVSSARISQEVSASTSQPTAISVLAVASTWVGARRQGPILTSLETQAASADDLGRLRISRYQLGSVGIVAFQKMR